MGKWEEKPGRYSRKKPEPSDRGRTTKRLLNVPRIDDQLLDDAQERARERLRDKWQSNRPQDLETLDGCEECQQQLDRITWQVDMEKPSPVKQPESQKLEALFDPCPNHQALISDWVYEMLNEMDSVIQQETGER